MARGGTSRTVKSVETLFAIVDILRDANGARVTEIAERLDVANSTVHRHLATLEQHRYVVQEGDVYYLASRFVNLGQYVKRRRDAYSLVAEKVEELAHETGELVQFAVEEQGRAVYLSRARGSRAVTTGVDLGQPLYLHSIAAGKAILARLPERRVREIVSNHGLPRLTSQTITDEEVLFDQLAEIRERGYAYNNQERIKGLEAVAAPVSGPDERVIGSVTIAGPTKRMNSGQLRDELPDLITGSVNELEINIAYTNV